MNNTYNNCVNYETWYIKCKIDNEYNLYFLKVEYGCQKNATYNGIREYAKLAGIAGEGISWDDDKLDYTALDEFIREG